MDTETQELTTAAEEEVSTTETTAEQLSDTTESEASEETETTENTKTYTQEELDNLTATKETEWQSRKDKETKPLYETIKAHEATIADLTNKLDTKASDALFAADLEDGVEEDKAQKAKTYRERIIARSSELAHLEKLNTELPEVIKELLKREKNVQAQVLAFQNFPGGDAKSSKDRDDFVKYLKESDAETTKDLELLARARSAEIKSKSPNKQKPVSSRGDEGGPRKDETPEEKVTRGLAEKAKRK